jgi:uncharacterized protein YceK
MPSDRLPAEGHAQQTAGQEKRKRNDAPLTCVLMEDPMRQSAFVLFLFITISTALGSNDCATIRTMPTLSSYGSPKVFSGVRLDYNAATENISALGKFKAEAPTHPLIDLLFSAILDTVILPVTLSVATYELIFE